MQTPKNMDALKTAKWVGIGLVALIAFVIVGKILYSLLKKDDENVTRAKTNRVLKQEIKNNDLSYSDSEYEAMANSLAEAFRGFGTDEETVFRVLNKLQNEADWKKLQYVYNSIARDVASYSWNNYTPDLVSALNEELDSSELDKVNSILLQRAGTGI